MYYNQNSKNPFHSSSNYKALFHELNNKSTWLEETYGFVFGGYWLWIQNKLLPFD